MEITLNKIKQRTRPSLISRNVVTFTFFFKSKCYNYRQHPNFSSAEFINLETFESYSSRKLNLDKSFSEETTAAELDAALADLLYCSSAREFLVECAMQKLLRALQTEPLCKSKCRFSMEIDLEIETVCHHVYHQYYNNGMDMEMVPAAQWSIRSLSTCGIERCTENRNCSVCLEDFVAGQALVSMPCDHVFHGGCIDKWLSTSHYCPLCRFEMPTVDEFFE